MCDGGGAAAAVRGFAGAAVSRSRPQTAPISAVSDGRSAAPLVTDSGVSAEEFDRRNDADGAPLYVLRHERPRVFDDSVASAVVAPAGASRLPRDVLCDRIRGVVFGNALGDAVGLATEFMNRETLAALYPGLVAAEPRFSFDDIALDRHRSNFLKGDWTDDSDQMIAILECMLCHGGRVEQRDLARRLLHWAAYGFPELHDLCGLGLGRTTDDVMHRDRRRFLEDPTACAKATWQRFFDNTGRYPLANGGVMRTSICGVPNFHDLDFVCENARLACTVTHYDPLCVASCVAIDLLVAQLLQGADCGSAAARRALAAATVDETLRRVALGDEQQAELRRFALPQSLEELRLDEGTSIGYTLKCMGSGFWAFAAEGDCRTLLLRLVAQGGDADTNAAVAGAVLGARFGYSALPRDLLAAMPFEHWLGLRVDRLLRLMGLAAEES